MATDRLTEILSQIESELSAKKLAIVPDQYFDLIGSALLETTRRREWAMRPRTWFLLNKIRRLDTMPTFIALGLNDASLPYQRSSRKLLPESLTYGQFTEFIEIQKLIDSDVLGLENGRHVLVKDGDQLFEPRRVTLGAGSQG